VERFHEETTIGNFNVLVIPLATWVGTEQQGRNPCRRRRKESPERARDFPWGEFNGSAFNLAVLVHASSPSFTL
jgi:hypothetical protein